MSHDFIKGRLLKIFVGEADQAGGEPLYEKVVALAKEQGLSGAMVIRGIESYGQGGDTHTARILRLAEDLPVVVEIAESEEKIESFLPLVDALFDEAGCGGVVTVADVALKKYQV